MKTFIKLFMLSALIVYLVFAFTNFTKQEDKTACRQLCVTIADSTHAGFITVEETERLLKEASLYPIGKQMEAINCILIEQALKKNTLIDSVSCYKSPNGTVNLLIQQRLPLMRIMAENGEEYYLDENGKPMKADGYVADLVVATGNITKAFARRNLVKIGHFLRNDAFWDSQIEQINVLPNQHIELIPRVGSHTISFGTTDNMQQKFRNLYTFYEKVLPEVGWNKYKEISVEHTTQIVGKRAKSQQRDNNKKQRV